MCCTTMDENGTKEEGMAPCGLSVTVLMAALTTLVACWLLFERKRSTPRRNLPPGPWSVPILGSMPFLGMWDNDIHLALLRLSKKYGDIFHFWLGNKLVVALNNYQLIHEALVENAVAMSGRPQENVNQNMKQKGLVLPTNTKEWRHDRNICLSILKEFGFGKTIMEDRILEEVEATLTHLDQLRDTAFDPSHVMKVSVSNVICSIVLGKHFKHDDSHFLSVIETMDSVMNDWNEVMIVNFLPMIWVLPSKRRAHKRMVENDNWMLDYFMTFITKHKKCHEKGDNSDFIHAYLDRIGDEVDGESLVHVVYDLFFTGTETTATFLLWSFVYMANYPDVQKKVQEELDGVLQDGCLPSLRDKTDLPYTEAVILEILRLAAVAPQTVPHETLDDVFLSGYLIPKGTMVMGNLWSVLRNPELWPEPDKMKPERFLTDDGNTVLHRPELIPFSLGRRSCLGEIMARQEMFLFFAAILHNYSIERPDGVDKIDEGGMSLTTRLPKPYRIITRKRFL